MPIRINFITGKASAKFKDVHITIPNGALSITQYTKADIRNGYIIPQESPVYGKSEKYELFRKQNYFGVVAPNVQIDAEFDNMVSRILFELEQRSLFLYKKLCDLDRDLKQTAFILLTQKFTLGGYVITGQRHRFATLKNSNFISLFQCKVDCIITFLCIRKPMF